VREAWRSCAHAGRLEELEAAAPAWFEILEARSFIATGSRQQAAGSRRAIGRQRSRRQRALTRLGIVQRFGARRRTRSHLSMRAVVILERLESAPDLRPRSRRARFTRFLLGRLDEAGTVAEDAIRIAEGLGRRRDPCVPGAARAGSCWCNRAGAKRAATCSGGRSGRACA
jgi:hypothetical protein